MCRTWRPRSDSEDGLIRWKQEAQFGQHSHISFTNPDFVKLAEAFGCIGIRISDADSLGEELETAFQRASLEKLPVLIDCPVDYAENMELSRRLGEMSSAERTAALKKSELSCECSGESVDLLADLMEARAFQPGEVVCEQGSLGSDVFLVVNGEASVGMQRGDQKVTHRMTAGTCFREMAVLADQPRAATVVAGAEGMETLALEGQTFREALLHQPQIAMELLKVFSQRVAAAQNSE